MNLKNNFEELEDLKQNIDLKEKNKIIDKILKSKKIDKIIVNLQRLYNNILEKLFIKYDLKNEIKQGKIFTILITILLFIYIVIISIFFFVMLNSLFGINFIFSILKYSIFFIKWGYMILKNKGNVIKKYLANLFPNSKILKETKNQNKTYLPVFEFNILKEIQDLTFRLEKLDIDILLLKNFALRLKELVKSLKLSEEGINFEVKSIEYKKEIIEKLVEIKNEIREIELKKTKEQTFIELKIDTTYNIDKVVKNKIYSKTKNKKY